MASQETAPPEPTSVDIALHLDPVATELYLVATMILKERQSSLQKQYMETLGLIAAQVAPGKSGVFEAGPEGVIYRFPA